jgi:hypothetical protein
VATANAEGATADGATAVAAGVAAERVVGERADAMKALNEITAMEEGYQAMAAM